MSTFAIILLVLAVIITLYIVMTHNAIITYFNACQRAWADVITQELQKTRLLPSLEKMVNEYKIHEADVMKIVTELRSALKNISPTTPDVSALQRVNSESKALMSNINLVAENYPELKASEVYQRFMRELSELEGNISASIRIFNANVEAFNTKIEVFPSVFINDIITRKARLDVFTDVEAAGNFSYKPNF